MMCLKIKHSCLIEKKQCKPSLKKFYHYFAFQSSHTFHTFLFPHPRSCVYLFLCSCNLAIILLCCFFGRVCFHVSCSVAVQHCSKSLRNQLFFGPFALGCILITPLFSDFCRQRRLFGITMHQHIPRVLPRPNMNFYLANLKRKLQILVSVSLPSSFRSLIKLEGEKSQELGMLQAPI